MQMKVLMCPVILGCVVPWRPRNFLEETGQDCWGVGPCPEGILAESFSQNAMWPSLPHGAVGILRGCGIADSTRLSDGHGHEHRDGCLWWLAVFLAVFCTWREGLLMACHTLSFTHCLKFILSFKDIVDIENQTDPPQSPFNRPFRTWSSSAGGVWSLKLNFHVNTEEKPLTCSEKNVKLKIYCISMTTRWKSCDMIEWLIEVVRGGSCATL